MNLLIKPSVSDLDLKTSRTPPAPSPLLFLRALVWAPRQWLYRCSRCLWWTAANYPHGIPDLHKRIPISSPGGLSHTGYGSVPVTTNQPPLFRGAPGIAVVQAKKVHP